LMVYGGDVRVLGKEALAMCLIDKSIKLISNMQNKKYETIQILNGARSIMHGIECISEVEYDEL